MNTTINNRCELVLKQEIVDIIKKDGILYGKVAVAVGVTPGSLKNLLLRNHKKLTLAAPLEVIKEHLGLKDTNKLLEKQAA